MVPVLVAVAAADKIKNGENVSVTPVLVAVAAADNTNVVLFVMLDTFAPAGIPVPDTGWPTWILVVLPPDTVVLVLVVLNVVVVVS